MSNMDPKVAAQPINYVTLHDKERVRNEAVPLEEFIEKVLAQLSIPTRSEFDALAKKVADLSARK